MNTPEYVIAGVREGTLGLETATYLLSRMIDRENVDQIMRMMPKYLIQFMRIEAGLHDRTLSLNFHGLPPPESYRVAALSDWLEQNGYPVIWEKHA